MDKDHKFILCVLHVGFLLGLLIREDGGDVFQKNIA
jgi:hypothetical protein